jgi:hypothetical protein
MNQARARVTVLDETATIETSTELRDLARVLKRALGVIVAYWIILRYPETHPYRQAARMIECYLERRYRV